MSVKLLTEQHLEFLNLKGGWTGSSRSTCVKMLDCWKSHVRTHIFNNLVKSLLIMSACSYMYFLENHSYVALFVCLLYVPSQQLWSLRDGQFT